VEDFFFVSKLDEVRAPFALLVALIRRNKIPRRQKCQAKMRRELCTNLTTNLA
jgi:hypothetical protein